MTINANTEFGLQEGVDNTAKIQAAFDAAAQRKEKLEINPGIYPVEGTLNMGAIKLEADGTVIEHRPTSDIDCLIVDGENSRRTKIEGLTVVGYVEPGVAQKGRDLVTVRKGDYVNLDSVTIETPKRDALCVRPSSSYQWVENMILQNVKVQSPGRDSFHFEVSNVVTRTFINQVTMLNCESRAAVRHALGLFNDAADTAQKISNFKVINSELAAAPGADAIVRISGSASNGFIENIDIEETAIEQTEGQRTGAGVEITGKMSGFFRLENSIIFGTASKVVGHELFPHFQWRDVSNSAYVPLYSSHTGLFKKIRTASLASGAYQDVLALNPGEELEGTIFDRYNSADNATWYAKFVTFGKNVHVIHAANVDVSVVNGQLRVTNRYGTTSLEIMLRRTVKETGN